MLNFIITTFVFSLAVFSINRYFDTLAVQRSSMRTLLVMVAATFISIAAGWAVDAIDGDAALHKNDPSITEIVQSGDPLAIAKLLAGMH